MVRVLLSNVSFMHILCEMNEKSYYYRKVELLAFWNKHSTKQIWKCRSAYHWKWQHLWLLNCMNAWIPLHKIKWLIFNTADTHTLSLPPLWFIWCCIMNTVCIKKLNLIHLKSILSTMVLYPLCCLSLHNYIWLVDVCRRREAGGREPGSSCKILLFYLSK